MKSKLHIFTFYILLVSLVLLLLLLSGCDKAYGRIDIHDSFPVPPQQAHEVPETGTTAALLAFGLFSVVVLARKTSTKRGK